MATIPPGGRGRARKRDAGVYLRKESQVKSDVQRRGAPASKEAGRTSGSRPNITERPYDGPDLRHRRSKRMLSDDAIAAVGRGSSGRPLGSLVGVDFRDSRTPDSRTSRDPRAPTTAPPKTGAPSDAPDSQDEDNESLFSDEEVQASLEPEPKNDSKFGALKLAIFRMKRRARQKVRAKARHKKRVSQSAAAPKKKRFDIRQLGATLRAIPWRQARAVVLVSTLAIVVVCLWMAYRMPTSAAGLEALLKLATLGTGLAILMLPMSGGIVRRVERCLLALCAAGVVLFGDPTAKLAHNGADLRLMSDAVQERAGAVRALISLGRRNFAGVDLRGADLGGIDLSFCSLEGAQLQRANLSYANLTRTNLDNARIAKADLNGAELIGASVSRAKGFEETHCTRRTRMPKGYLCKGNSPVSAEAAMAAELEAQRAAAAAAEAAAAAREAEMKAAIEIARQQAAEAAAVQEAFKITIE